MYTVVSWNVCASEPKDAMEDEAMVLTWGVFNTFEKAEKATIKNLDLEENEKVLRNRNTWYISTDLDELTAIVERGEGIGAVLNGRVVSIKKTALNEIIKDLDLNDDE